MSQDQKISQLTSAASLTGPEHFPVVQSGNTVKATVAQILSSSLFTQSGTGAVPRPIETDLREKYIYASQFGMDQSASAATNTTAINNALAFAKTTTGQKTVVMPPGTLNINGFTPPGTSASSADTNGITLKGAGNGYQQQPSPNSGVATTLKFAAGVTSGLGSTKTYGIYQDNTKHWCNFEDFAIDGNSVLDYGMRICTQATYKRIRVQGCNGHGFRGQTLDSTICEDLVAVSNVGGGMLMDQAAANDSVNVTPNTTTTIRGIFSNNGTIGLEIKQLLLGRIQAVVQSNTSYGVKVKNDSGVSALQWSELDLWLENNGGGVDKYQILIDSADAANFPFDNVFRGRIDPLSTNKSIHIVKGQRNKFLRTIFTNAATGVIDLDAGATDTVFQDCLNSDGTGTLTINDSGTRNYQYGKPVTPTFSAGDFTASGAQTWTVGSGDVTTYEYTVRDKIMTLNVKLVTTTVGGTPDQELIVKIPAGFVAAHDYEGYNQNSDNGAAFAIGVTFCTAGQAILRSLRSLHGAAGNWSAATNTTYLYFTATLGVA